MRLTSPKFDHEGKIPSKYTCDGEDISPPLKIEGVPKAAKSLALIMDDPDVPKYSRADGMWDHWVVFNIPAHTCIIEEGRQPEGRAGMGTEKKLIYRGPAPPDREHRYFFNVFALDTLLDLKEGATKNALLKAMEGHILDQAVLMGRYERIP